jgi:uncharacterized protein (DUF952 family)
MPGGGEHRTPGLLFPHVYGPIDRAAIVGVGVLHRAGERFSWPGHWERLSGESAVTP